MSIILQTDSYKTSHWLQYPPETETVYSYLESRGGPLEVLVFTGLVPIIQKFFTTPITQQDIDRADAIVTAHMGPGIFNRAGWDRILTVHNGLLPLHIRALPEGSKIAPHNVMMTIENTDPALPWVTNYVETLLLQVWYPITVASVSYKIRTLILSYLEKTGTPDLIDYKLHDFGFRGVSSTESAGIGGAAHALSFNGSDTMAAIDYILKYYQVPDESYMPVHSIPAAEHSTIIAWGETKEYEAYRNMVEQFGDRLYAVVSDAYDIDYACDTIWGQMLKSRVTERGGTLVVRPDSGDPATIVLRCIETLGNRFGYTTNDKGFKVLNTVRVIQGDGIEYDSIHQILETLSNSGWSADNIAFGMGGALLQKIDRDTAKFAIKASWVSVNGKGRDIYKNPATDRGKRSKAGRFKVVKLDDGRFVSTRLDESMLPDEMVTFYMHFQNYTEIRSEKFEDMRANVRGTP